MRSMSELGPKLLGAKALDVALAVQEVERLFPLPPKFRELLVAVGGALIFDKGAKYQPEEPTPLTKEDGYNSLESLFGLGDGKDSIKRAVAQYEGELPSKLVPIGQAPGGNLICVNASGIVFLWDHESQMEGRAWRVASSLDQFLERLEPDDSKSRTTHGIVESESFLDF